MVVYSVTAMPCYTWSPCARMWLLAKRYVIMSRTTPRSSDSARWTGSHRLSVPQVSSQNQILCWGVVLAAVFALAAFGVKKWLQCFCLVTAALCKIERLCGNYWVSIGTMSVGRFRAHAVSVTVYEYRCFQLLHMLCHVVVKSFLSLCERW